MCKLGYGHTLNSYFFVFVCHYYISRRIHTHKRIVLLLVKIFCCSHLSPVSSERSSISLLRRRRSRSKKKEARLFHSLRRRAFPTLREKSRNRPFFLSRFLSTRKTVSFANTRRAVEHQRSSLTRKTQSIILSRGQSVLSLAIEKKKRLSLRNPFLPTLTTTTTKKRASRLKNRRKKFFSTEREKEAREKTESRARAKRWYPLAGEKDVRERRARCRRFSFCYFRCCYFRRRRRRREQQQQQQQQQQ